MQKRITPELRGSMLRPFRGPCSSSFERLRQFSHVSGSDCSTAKGTPFMGTKQFGGPLRDNN
eukprot:884839-Alexandrium_andersonii.AAC.1